MLLRIFTLVTIALLSGCNTPPETRPFIPESASHETAILYIYRPAAMANAIYSPAIFVNGEQKTTIKNKSFSLLRLMPGKQVIEIAPQDYYTGLTKLVLTTTTNQNYYIRIDTSISIKSATDYQPYQREFNLTLIDEQLAITEIEKCCQSTVATEQKPAIKVDASPKDGFSVDKTQNPFSH